MRRNRLWLLPGIALCVPFGAGCAPSEQTSLSAGDRKQMIETSRQAEINVKSYQINHSNLPPEQKQRLLAQLRAGAGK